MALSSVPEVLQAYEDAVAAQTPAEFKGAFKCQLTVGNATYEVGFNQLRYHYADPNAIPEASIPLTQLSEHLAVEIANVSQRWNADILDAKERGLSRR